MVTMADAATILLTQFHMSRTSIEERLVTGMLPNPDTGCWEWQRSRSQDGYGWITDGPGNHKHTHKAAYQVWRGPVPVGLYVCHRCDNPGCINPEHLFLGTPKDNMRDMVEKKRHVFGERCSYAKLSDAIVREIFAGYAAGNGYERLAKQMGLREKAIMGIIQRSRWKHVEIDPVVLQRVEQIRSERALKYCRSVAA